jgi:hypothetical protein
MEGYARPICRLAIIEEGLPVEVADIGGFVDIIHACAAQLGIIEHKAARLDNMDGGAHAGRKAQTCAKILGDIGLVEDKVYHGGGDEENGNNAWLTEAGRNCHTIHYSPYTIHSTFLAT